MAAQMEVSGTGTGSGLRFLVLAATPTRLYLFTGITSLEATFGAYTGTGTVNGRPPKITELPSTLKSRCPKPTPDTRHPMLP